MQLRTHGPDDLGLQCGVFIYLLYACLYTAIHFVGKPNYFTQPFTDMI